MQCILYLIDHNNLKNVSKNSLPLSLVIFVKYFTYHYEFEFLIQSISEMNQNYSQILVHYRVL